MDTETQREQLLARIANVRWFIGRVLRDGVPSAPKREALNDLDELRTLVEGLLQQRDDWKRQAEVNAQAALAVPRELSERVRRAERERDELEATSVWGRETFPTGEGAEALAKARRGEGLTEAETLEALRAAMEVADAAKRKGIAAERERDEALRAFKTEARVCNARTKMLEEAKRERDVALPRRA